MDETLGLFFSALAKRGLYDKALIVFTSDVEKGSETTAKIFTAFLCIRALLAVPLIFHWPAGSNGFRRAS